MISVIVPVYNVKKYLKRCICSLLNQSYIDYEIILIDDGSNDGSSEICDKYARKYDKIAVYHKENGGLSSARNYGIVHSSGEYITFVDSDDYVSPQYLEVLEKLVCNDRSAIGFVNMINGSCLNYHFTIINGFNRCVVKHNDFVTLFFKTPFAQSCCGKIFPRTVFKDQFFIEGRTLEDTAITYNLYYRASKIVVTDIKLYYYYKRTGSIMHSSFNMKAYNAIYSYEERLEFIRVKGTQKEYERFMQQYVALGLKYYYLLKKFIPFEGKEAQELLGKIKDGYWKCYKSREWNLMSKIGGRIGLFLPYLMGYFVNLILG